MEKEIPAISVHELRLEIINKVSGIADAYILEEINRLIDRETMTLQKYRLTDDEKTALEVGLQDVALGDLHSSDSAQELIEEWLKR